MSVAAHARVLAAAAIFSLAPNVAAAVPCYTHSEAREKWPNSHIFWHTEARCWDTHPRGAEHYDKRPTMHLQIMPANVADAPAEMVKALAKLPREPATVLFPELEVNAWPYANARPEMLTAMPVTDWPLLIDIDVPRQFGPWRERITGAFK